MSQHSRYNMEVDGIRLDANNEEFMQALVLAQSTDKISILPGRLAECKWEPTTAEPEEP